MKAKKGYNKLGTGYSHVPERFYNKYIEMPAVKKTFKGVKGKKVLDVGCGTGAHTEVLHKLGAKVTGVDISKEMIQIAKKNLPSVEFKVADMKKLPFKAKSFDVLFSGLSLHYEKNLDKVFKEAYRVLKPKGRLIFSTYNPYCTGQKKLKVKNKVYRVVVDYFKGTKRKLRLAGIDFNIYPKTISGLFNSLVKAGFQLTSVSEPQPVKSAKKQDLKRYEKTMRRPSFIVVEALKPPQPL